MLIAAALIGGAYAGCCRQRERTADYALVQIARAVQTEDRALFEQYVDTEVNVGDVVVGSQCCYHDVWCGEGAWGQMQGLPLYFDGSRKILDIVEGLSLDNLHTGLICTGDQFITESIGLQAIKRNFPKALAVDMESAAMAHICYQRNIPFASIRVISDTPDKETDNQTQYFDCWETAPNRTFDVLKKVLEKL